MVNTPSENDTFFGLDISEARKTLSSFRRKISKRFLLIEFGIESLTYCEARVIKDLVFYSKLNRVSIDKSALERGTPTEPEAMASFLSQIIEEEQIFAHRVGIILPPQAVLSKLIYLPINLNYNDAIDFVSNPSTSGFQFPISIENTDFDLIPIDSLPVNQLNKTKPYFLISIPKKLVDNVIETLSKADLELHTLDVAYSSLERLFIESINNLKINQIIILIELALECTHIYMLSSKGPIYISTLAAIREFKAKDDYDGERSIEDYTINSENYLAISELDLKVLLNEVRDEIDQFKNNYDLEICEIILSGVNSSHPGIKNYFTNYLNIETNILRSISSNFIGDINLSKPIVMQDLNRIIGTGLSIIQGENSSQFDVSNVSIKNNLINSNQENKNNELKSEDIDPISQNRSNISKKDFSDNKSKLSDDNLYVFNNEDIQENKENLESNNISFEDFLKRTNLEDQKVFNPSNQLSSDTINGEEADYIKDDINSSLSGDSDLYTKEKELSNINAMTARKIINDTNEDFIPSDQNIQKDSSVLDLGTNLENTVISSPKKNSENEFEMGNDIDLESLNTKKNIENKSDSKQKLENNEDDEFNMPLI